MGLTELQSLLQRKQALETGLELARRLRLSPQEAETHGLSLNKDGVRRNILDLFGYPSVTRRDIARIWPELAEWSADVWEQVEIAGRYQGYMDRQAADAKALEREENAVLPERMNYLGLPGLSRELADKLTKVQPSTLGQAARIEGMTPAALTRLLQICRRERVEAESSAAN